ncbi:alpha-galactosidase [Maribellus comscasis]|uniref:Alpha-galactosidase n=1 Tax=Maribellus comscasis TaxID=2681766 RepID=A0A6I6JQN1_9BACT|nr:glycoside hydrolase family 27 protein [Maribellus comscasis]QGY43358.1 alpha-galactosidase [Maribellus comscasis]
MKLKKLISAAAGFLVMLQPLLSQNKTPEFYSLAENPPMGWNSWDCYGPTVTEKEVKANTDYMAEKLKSFGWQYIVVDIRWYVENTKAQGYNQTDPVYCMDEYGRLIPATNKFPSSAGNQGFKPIADYIHKKGLKFGIHLMRGIPVEAVKKDTPVKGTKYSAKDIFSEELQCKWLRDMYTVDASKPGAQEYYNSLFELYASWEVDYVKIDNLSRPYHQKEIELIRNAIENCGRPMVLSTSPGATPLENAEHVKTHANLWRICDDFWDNWRYMAPMFELCKNWAPYSGPGHWPDADMLPLGRISIRGERGEERMTGFTKDEQYTLMNLWAIFRSPLMFGGDLPSNDDFTLSLITNKDILNVNQNSTNNHELKNEKGLIVWTANVPNSKDKYLAFFNSNDKETRVISVTMKELGLNNSTTVTNLWSKEKETVKNEKIIKKIAPHASAIFRLSQN